MSRLLGLAPSRPLAAVQNPDIQVHILHNSRRGLSENTHFIFSRTPTLIKNIQQFKKALKIQPNLVIRHWSPEDRQELLYFLDRENIVPKTVRILTYSPLQEIGVPPLIEVLQVFYIKPGVKNLYCHPGCDCGAADENSYRMHVTTVLYNNNRDEFKNDTRRYCGYSYDNTGRKSAMLRQKITVRDILAVAGGVSPVLSR
jgi:hypothetical protein